MEVKNKHIKSLYRRKKSAVYEIKLTNSKTVLRKGQQSKTRIKVP